MNIKNIQEYIISHKYKFVLGISIAAIVTIILIVNNIQGNVVYFEEVSSEYTSETTTEYTTYDITETTTFNYVSDNKKTENKNNNNSEEYKCYYNNDGNLYGVKGQFSGLWRELEIAARNSNEQYIKDLIPFVGDNSTLRKTSYENDKFKDINGYGTVCWSQGGHNWPNRYSAAASGYIVTEENVNEAFEEVKQNTNSEVTSDKNNKPISVSEMVLSDSAVNTEEISKPKTVTKKMSFEQLPAGKRWGSQSCGVCSLAMALSTLSGVTVSPPEVALAANLLIGKSAWYDSILYSKSQAKLAQLAGFKVVMEPYNQAKQATMDDCLNSNGVALFVTNKSVWASGGGKHYIMVRNKVGDMYYTADSGKNPTRGFTYEEISSGYCQQYIVYIYPKE